MSKERLRWQRLGPYAAICENGMVAYVAKNVVIEEYEEYTDGMWFWKVERTYPKSFKTVYAVILERDPEYWDSHTIVQVNKFYEDGTQDEAVKELNKLTGSLPGD